MEVKNIKRGDIYYADLEPVIGSEQGGVRPVVIVQNDVGNKYSPTVIIAPITSQQAKASLPTHVSITSGKLPKDSMALLEQIRTVDKSRLLEYIGELNEHQLQKIDKAMGISLGLKTDNRTVDT